MNLKKLKKLVLFLLVSSCFAVNKTYLFNVPTGCPTGFTTPVWKANTSYYGVAIAQLGNAWVSNAGNVYRNESGKTATSGNTGGPTCTSGTCVDGGVTWRFKTSNVTQCTDDIAHFIYSAPTFDGQSLYLPWGADSGGLGFEKSNAANTGSGGYDFTAYDSFITNSALTGIMDNPNWPSRAQLVIPTRSISNPGSAGNIDTPNYIYSTAYQSAVSAPNPQSVAFCTNYPGVNNGGTLPTNTVVNISTGGVVLATLTTGWPLMSELPAATGWKAALAKMFWHLGSVPYMSKIDYVRVGGTGTGSEAFMACVDQWKTFLSQNNAQIKTTWTNWSKSLADAVNADVPPLTVQYAPNCATCLTGTIDYTWADLEAQYEQAESIKPGIGSNGFSLSDVNIYATSGAADGTGISGNFAYLWKTYPNSPVHEFQTIAQTDPTNAGVGSLPNLLSFMALRCAEVAGQICAFEGFWQDWCIAYCPTYANYATYHTAYAKAISDFRAGGILPPTGLTVTGVN
jgi:hypothetical protein